MAGLTKHVEFGKQLTGYHETADGGVLACFTDGSSIAGDLLVGADGVGSAVRRQLLPHAEVVRLRGESLLGRTPLTERFRHMVPGYGTMVRGPRARMLLGKMEFRIPPHIAARESSATADLPETGDYVRWVVFLNGQEGPVPGVWPEARSLILKAVASWHPDLRALVEHSDHVNSSALTTSFAKPVPRWKTRPITLLGDAIHVMPPSGGQGANTALRDAALLCRVLCSAPGGRVGLLEAVETYERLMLDYGFAAVAKSLDEASMPRR